MEGKASSADRLAKGVDSEVRVEDELVERPLRADGEVGRPLEEDCSE